MTASWWAWDLNTEKRAKVQLFPHFNNMQNYPFLYIIAKQLYDKLVELENKNSR
mgnify:FL=1